jgi:hypothetical protein
MSWRAGHAYWGRGGHCGIAPVAVCGVVRWGRIPVNCCCALNIDTWDRQPRAADSSTRKHSFLNGMRMSTRSETALDAGRRAAPWSPVCCVMCAVSIFCKCSADICSPPRWPEAREREVRVRDTGHPQCSQLAARSSQLAARSLQRLVRLLDSR